MRRARGSDSVYEQSVRRHGWGRFLYSAKSGDDPMMDAPSLTCSKPAILRWDGRFRAYLFEAGTDSQLGVCP